MTHAEIKRCATRRLLVSVKADWQAITPLQRNQLATCNTGYVETVYSDEQFKGYCLIKLLTLSVLECPFDHVVELKAV